MVTIKVVLFFIDTKVLWPTADVDYILDRAGRDREFQNLVLGIFRTVILGISLAIYNHYTSSSANAVIRSFC